MQVQVDVEDDLALDQQVDVEDQAVDGGVDGALDGVLDGDEGQVGHDRSCDRVEHLGERSPRDSVAPTA